MARPNRVRASTMNTLFHGICALALLGSAGCARFDAIDECQRIIGLVNPSLDTIEQIAGGQPESPQQLHAVSKAYAKLSADLGVLEVTNPKVSKEVKEYATFIKKVADNTKVYSVALKTQQRRKLTVARHTATKQAQRHKMLVKRLNRVCRPR